VLPSSTSERSRRPDPKRAFRSSIARPTDTPVYASNETSRSRLQDSRPGWSRCLLSCRALSSPTTCRFRRTPVCPSSAINRGGYSFLLWSGDPRVPYLSITACSCSASSGSQRADMILYMQAGIVMSMRIAPTYQSTDSTFAKWHAK
jgi:hypothetical protein